MISHKLSMNQAEEKIIDLIFTSSNNNIIERGTYETLPPPQTLVYITISFL